LQEEDLISARLKQLGRACALLDNQRTLQAVTPVLVGVIVVEVSARHFVDLRNLGGK
jgi:hypothetical protein